MAYFSRKQDGIERGGKIVADIFCGLLLFALCVVCFGTLMGLLAFVVLEAAILSVDYLVPDEDDAPGAAVR
jgi:hypothetical protein